MLTKIHIENFKSLVNVDITLSKFTCLIGLNGAGKSTLLQALDFIAHVATGEVEDWLKVRDWKKGELVSNTGARKHTISFTVCMESEHGEIQWKARFNVNHLKCTWEQVVLGQQIIMKLEEGKFETQLEEIDKSWTIDANFTDFSGSVLSLFNLGRFHPTLNIVKQQMKGLKSMELLSPRDLRKRAKKAEDIGIGGEKLSAFLSSFTKEQQSSLLKQLQTFYPNLESWQIQTLRAGWKNLWFTENSPKPFRIDATHMNDGLLRILAILAQAEGRHRFLLFDEIENGFNPVMAGRLVDALVGLGDLGKQVLVTTHSPVLLNFMEDGLAKESVRLVYRTPGGETKVCSYFEQPETQHKLRGLGPGEVYLDADLESMVARLSVAAQVQG